MTEIKVPKDTKADYDYIAFSFCGLHSYEDFGIYRIGGADEKIELTSQISDIIIDRPDGDGQYYFGTSNKSKVFNIKFAFDNVTEKTIKRIRAWLDTKDSGDLWFSEAPHRVYKAIITGSSTVTTTAFDEAGKGRLYKGTGSVQFTCHQVYARTPDIVITSTGQRLSGNAHTSYLDFPNYEEIKAVLPKQAKVENNVVIAEPSAFGALPFTFCAKLLSPFDQKEITIQSDIVGESYYIDNATYSEEDGIYIINNGGA